MKFIPVVHIPAHYQAEFPLDFSDEQISMVLSALANRAWICCDDNEWRRKVVIWLNPYGVENTAHGLSFKSKARLEALTVYGHEYLTCHSIPDDEIDRLLQNIMDAV